MTNDPNNLQLLDDITIQALRDKCKNDLFVFAKGVLGFNRLEPHIHLPLCKLLEDYKSKTRLSICLPRGWYKTTLASISYPIWRCIRDSDVRCAVIQNTHPNAIGKLSSIDTIFRKNDLFRALFPELIPNSQCVWTREKMCVPRTGTFPEATFEGAGIRTKLTSRHYNVIDEDDTVAPDLDEMGADNLVPTKDDIGTAIGFHRNCIPLLVDPTLDQLLVVGTRWFEEDLLSFIENNEKYYTFYKRSCLEDDSGLSDIDGTPTFPERFPMDVLLQIKAAMGEYLFNCLYLNNPTRTGDMLFKIEWFKKYDTLPQGHTLLYYTTVDPAGDPEDTLGKTDYAVIMTCALDIDTGQKYVVHYDRIKGSPGDTLDKIFEHGNTYKPVKIGIEATAAQKIYMYLMRERMKKAQKWFNIEPIIQGRKAKNARIQGLQPMFASGQILIKSHMRAIESEALAFPYGKNDDLLDALAMQHGLWALTAIKPQKREVKEDDDPLSLNGVLARVHEKRKHDLKSSRIFDLARKQRASGKLRLVFKNGRLTAA